jgi:2-polyprenyl-6-methoxyphenol hydroxylase-like FAD-dependent oxidoreductase
MAGLLAARALSAHFARVTVVERDPLPEGSDLRKGVPQAGHAHGLLASGYRVIDEYFPGIMDELAALGAPRGDVVGDFLWFQYGHWKLRHPMGLRGITVSRPCLEATIRMRVRALPNLTFLDGAAADVPTFDPAAGRVTGITVAPRGGAKQSLDADLVVDATGRGSHAPKWLEQWGYTPPECMTIKVDVGYATRIFERRPGDFFRSMGAVISGRPPDTTRYAAVLAAEPARWVITLAGALGDYPPTDPDAWLKYAASLPHPAVHDLAASARPLSDITAYRFPANQRRLYEGMKRLPQGFAVIGDAICSFNPIYGQGMSVAAMEAKALDDTLREGAEAVPARFYKRAAKIADIPWAIATGEDLRFPQIEGRRPPGFGPVNRYLERVHAIASEDPVVCARFFDVLNLLAPPTAVLSPRIAWRVLSRRVPKSQGSPWGTLRPDSEAIAAT